MHLGKDSPDVEQIVRARVKYAGYVQGIGFRYTAVMISRNFSITGYVRNLRDGTVKLSAEGERSQVDAFLAHIRSDMKRHLSDETIEWVEPTGQYDGFQIRY